MKVLLIAFPPPGYKRGDPYLLPIGLMYISAALKKSGHLVECINFHHSNRPVDEVLRNLSMRKEFDFVGVGGMSYQYTMLKEAISKIRAVFPRARILVGGNIVTCMPEKVMPGLNADFGIVGEGDISTVELLECLEKKRDPRQVRGICIRDANSDEVVVTPPREGVDLDELPFPDYEGFEFGTYLDMVTPTTNPSYESFLEAPRPALLTASRSCPFLCSFCYHPPGQKYRQRSVESCFRELDFLIEKFGINHVSLNDEVLFTANNRDRINAFCAGFKARNLTFSCQTMVHAVDREILKTMHDAGCLQISYGVENVSETILKSMRKPITRAQIENALSLTYDCGIDIQANIIVGDPAETWDSFMENVIWWLQNRKYCIALIPLGVYPNSQVYLKAKEIGIIRDEIAFISSLAEHQSDLNVTSMSSSELRRIKRIADELQTTYAHYPGILESVEKCPGKDEYGRVFYSLSAYCTHCGEKNRYEKLYFFPTAEEKPLDYMYFISCRHCRRRYRIPNPAIVLSPGWNKRMYLTHYPTKPRRSIPSRIYAELKRFTKRIRKRNIVGKRSR